MRGDACLVLVALMLGLAGCGKPKAGGPPPTPPVVVAQPLQRQIVDWDESIGRFEAIEKLQLGVEHRQVGGKAWHGDPQSANRQLHGGRILADVFAHHAVEVLVGLQSEPGGAG